MATLYKKIVIFFRFLYDEICFAKLFLKKGQESNSSKFALLRRDCHILDKGLHSINFEKGHSKKQYLEAKKLQQELQGVYNNDKSYEWASKVITQYEQSQKDILAIDSATWKIWDDENRKFFFEMIKSRISCRNY